MAIIFIIINIIITIINIVNITIVIILIINIIVVFIILSYYVCHYYGLSVMCFIFFIHWVIYFVVC